MDIWVYCFVIMTILIAFMIVEMITYSLVSDYLSYHCRKFLESISGNPAYSYRGIVPVGKCGSVAEIAREMKNVSLRLDAMLDFYEKCHQQGTALKWRWRIIHKYDTAAGRWRALQKGLAARHRDKEEMNRLVASIEDSYDLRGKYKMANDRFWWVHNRESFI